MARGSAVRSVSTNATEFNRTLMALLEKKKDKAIEVAGKIVTDLHSDIQLATPKDTGRAQAGWQLSHPDETHWVIFNNVEYILELEAGSSRQAPKGMVAVTLVHYEAGIKMRLERL